MTERQQELLIEMVTKIDDGCLKICHSGLPHLSDITVAICGET